MQYLQKRNINRQSSGANWRNNNGTNENSSEKCSNIENAEEEAP